jgi:hypothetical protein
LKADDTPSSKAGSATPANKPAESK